MIRFLLGAVLIVLLSTAPLKAQSDCPPFRWGNFVSPGEQSHKVVNRKASSLNREIVEVHFGKLQGPLGKAFLFAEFQDGCLSRVVSVGSYETTNAIHQERNPGINYRLYHVDLYDSAGHSTLGFHAGPPDLESVRTKAMKIFSKPTSGSKKQ